MAPDAERAIKLLKDALLFFDQRLQDFLLKNSAELNVFPTLDVLEAYLNREH